LPFYYSFILVITLHYYFLLALAEYQPQVYFPLLLKPAAQKENMDWNSSIGSSRLRVALVAVPVKLWSLQLFHSIESCHSL
jgi:hypothetical protein